MKKKNYYCIPKTEDMNTFHFRKITFPQDNHQQKDKEKPLEQARRTLNTTLRYQVSSLYLASQPRIQSDPSNPRRRERKKVKGAGRNCNSRYREHTHPQ